MVAHMYMLIITYLKGVSTVKVAKLAPAFYDKMIAMVTNMEKQNNQLPTTAEIKKSVDLFKTFGDATRYQILSLLYQGSRTVSEITAVMDVSQSAISHQLKTLRQAGLVVGNRDGKFIKYTLADEHIFEIFELVKEHIQE